ncbi:MAG TPA: FAD-dependent oxidoreductase [Candidatus Eisenbacteria bacterium]|nr:FAD-dependent oxidoreductase [Candidatus Eisenbacteria bacterium]
MPESKRPDFSVGIAQEAFEPGQMIEGTYEGARVLLARVDDRFYAIGGECTHYGAPLCEGLLVGKTVLCPWHHARFELASGRATAPPALSGLKRYRVGVEAGRVRVLGLAPAASRPARPARGPESVVIVGAGAAGAIAAETLREEGFQGRVTLLDGEPSGPVDRPNLSKDYLAGNAPEEWLPLRSDDFYRERGIELRVATPVERVDPAARTVTLAGGEELEWGALLLAMGATPIRLPVPGAELGHVFTLRSLRDARAIIAEAGHAQSAVVVGASFIGLEVAAALRARKLDVHVVAPERIPMERVLGRDLGEFIRELHEQNGVRFHLGSTLEAIDRDHVILSDGARVDAELVVVGIGVRPSTELAEEAGLTCDRGILVDAMLRTSAPGVWAAGDLARWPDRSSGERVRIEHWVLAERLGQTAARNILGAEEPFRAVPFFWSRHYDVSIQYVGSAAGYEAADSVGDPRHGKGAVLFKKGGRVLAVASIGDARASLEAEIALDSADPAEIVEWERRLRATA